MLATLHRIDDVTWMNASFGHQWQILSCLIKCYKNINSKVEAFNREVYYYRPRVLFDISGRKA